MANLFQKLELEAFRAGITPRTQESRAWFRQKAQALTRINRRELMSSEEIKLVNKSNPLIGSMNMFFYDPKHKETLPYYDRFPLVIISGPAPGGFYGMNLHYISPIMRAKFLDGLMEVTNNKKFDDSTRFRARYEMINKIKSLRFYKPCYKHYLFPHVKSRLARVAPTEWEIATFLPTADWAKSSARNVYRQSREMI
tara:strand:- start:376 stop:966 length:591 start_codon:yes stop_codon:yes gene_type:complete